MPGGPWAAKVTRDGAEEGRAGPGHVDRRARGWTVSDFDFPDVPARSWHWWLVLTPGDADVCDTDPGFEVSVTVTADLRDMVRIWRGDLHWQDALRSGTIDLQGPEPVRRTLPTWFALSPFATIPRPAIPARGPSVG
ncbi:hypothetical protein [Actinomadura chokoriensis]|uniref:hypothetical protein n=1 Tax=Actinomadura chokoriensis TaxID=454156 RepID=UPI0031F75C8E